MKMSKHIKKDIVLHAMVQDWSVAVVAEEMGIYLDLINNTEASKSFASQICEMYGNVSLLKSL